MERTRVAIIELVRDGQELRGDLVLYECRSSEDLKRYLATYDHSRPDVLRRIFIVEWSEGGPIIGDAQPNTLRHVLETELQVPSDVFSEHASQGVGSLFEPQELDIINPYLISTCAPERRFSIGFFDLWEYIGETEALQTPCPETHRMFVPGDAGLTLMCGFTERQLQFHKWKARKGWLVIAPRKCSYWSRWVGEEEGTDVVMVFDPTVNTAVPKLPVGTPKSSKPISLNPRQPFLGGYQQVLPREVSVQGRLSDVTRNILNMTPAEVAGNSAHPPRPVNNPPETNTVEENEISPAAFQIAVQNGSAFEMTNADKKLKKKKGKQTELLVEPEEEVEEETEEKRLKKIEDLKQTILAGLKKPVSPRTSLFDDVRYYFARHTNSLGSLLGQNMVPHFPHVGSSGAALIPLKVMAGHYCLLHAFVSFQTAAMRSTGWKLKEDTTQQLEESKQVEESWSRFRCTEYLECLEALMDTLGIPLYGLGSCAPMETTPLLRRSGTGLTTGTIRESSPEPRWRAAVTPDFTYLHRQFTMRRHDYDRITTSIAALTGIVTGRSAVMEAVSARSLTSVALFFAPLAWITALYSVPEDLGPGGPLFWVYWVTAVPFMGVVWLAIKAWERRQDRRKKGTGERRGVIDDSIV
ncbi:hypothetical protein QBC37DRAFT_412093 [Rhypophila decipiens]|uniref:Uncharacterized protein n=1 Tax=Rhypophila decipiens TaxID=261697 RepID=A0AAN7BCD2_9PEZI|nr:hypothetical protein QBC37DRAFT_412093 [Rhypophila decipiens]